jgi:hypothetical protein
VSSDLDPLLKLLHLANTRRTWCGIVARAEHEQRGPSGWSRRCRRGSRASTCHTAQSRSTQRRFPFLRTIAEFHFSYQSTLRFPTMGSLLSRDFGNGPAADVLIQARDFAQASGSSSSRRGAGDRRPHGYDRRPYNAQGQLHNKPDIRTRVEEILVG